MALDLKGRIWISSEMMPVPRDKAYFASARFLHGAEIIEEIGCPTWFVDADAEIAHDASEAERLARETSAILGVISRGPFAYLPWRSFAAGWLYVPYRPSAIAYLRLVSNSIRYFWDDRPSRNWWIDQFALRTAEIIANDDTDIPPPQPVSAVTTNTFVTGQKNMFLAKHPEIQAFMNTGLSFKEAYTRVALGT
jgi:hypothetical protein